MQTAVLIKGFSHTFEKHTTLKRNEWENSHIALRLKTVVTVARCEQDEEIDLP